MKLQSVYFALVGQTSAVSNYMQEAMRGDRILSGVAVYDKPSWVPTFDDESPPFKGFRVTRELWELSCTSNQDSCQSAIDGKNTTAWHSETGPGPHNVTIDLVDQYAVSAIVVLPPISVTGTEGLITQHEVYISDDAESWTGPVSYGMWPNTNRQRLSAFEPASARYVRLTAYSPDNTWVGISEVNVFATLYTIAQDPSRGAWGPTIDLPVVPAAGAQEATGQVVLWSSWDDDQFSTTPGGKTAMSRWDFSTGVVSKRVVSNTQHDMFCPGISIDGDGMMVVTGGNDAAQTSLFNAKTNRWEKGTELNLERGYQASTTMSDGSVFVIGGSWAGGSNVDKNAEVYSPKTRAWTMLPGARVEPMLTNDMEGPWRADNHGWLFGWKDKSVFQAGPSRAMNWYGVENNGSVKGAGYRGEDEDSMSGNAVMFDALQGKILTMGGSPDYDKSWAHANAHIITLGEVGEEPTVEPAGEDGTMHFDRVFHTSVVLPDGKVFIVGGQAFGVAFNEENVRFVPELYDPEMNKFVKLQKHNMIRVYHSVSILIPDGRVLTGGGGLCGNCSANHYDAQIYTPPYLLTETGEPRVRPVIASALPDDIAVGGLLTFNTTGEINSASLIRISSATHTVNTDQRRVPLNVTQVPHHENQHEIQLPSDAGILIPGYWMLFVMDADGTPSIAETIMVTPKSNGRADAETQKKMPTLLENQCDPGLFNVCWENWSPTSLIVQIFSPNPRLDLVK